MVKTGSKSTSFIVVVILIVQSILIGLISVGLSTGTIYFETDPQDDGHHALNEIQIHSRAPGGQVSPAYAVQVDPETLIPPWWKKTGQRTIFFIMEGADASHESFGAPATGTFFNSFTRQLQRSTGRLPNATYDQAFEVVSCLTCAALSGGAWMSAVSLIDGAAVAAIVRRNADESASISHPVMHVPEDKWNGIDIGVKLGCLDEKLRRFTQGLQPIARDITHKVRIRLVVTRYPCDQISVNPSAATIVELEKLSGLQDRRQRRSSEKYANLDCVVFIEMTGTFGRAESYNALHKFDTDPKTLLLAIDVDMRVEKIFIWNAMAFVSPGVCAYFPIVWSEFDPESVSLVEKFNQEQLPEFSRHRGNWRRFGFGIYALSRLDSPKLLLDVKKYSGWGKEDQDMFNLLVSKSLHTVRKREYGLTHKWHPKDCADQSNVRANLLIDCVGVVASCEGSALSQYLRLHPYKNGTQPKRK